MRSWLVPFVALTIALVLGWSASVPPRALPADAPPSVFSAGRAIADIRAGFVRPHPIGSDENARVCDWLAGRMRAVGMAVRVQPAIGVRAEKGSVSAANVVNLVGVLPGRDRSAPALLIMAHYDTAPSSPGAGDDGFGVSTALEIARILRAEPRARDVVFLMTDGEEAGLLGARAFFASDPLRTQIGLVLNMDTRGDAGRAIMYETGPDPGALIRLHARETRDPTTDSIAAFVRKNIRNSSDFAVAVETGLPGLNYAVLGNQFNYHAASSTPDLIQRQSLQHYGASVLAVARPLARDAAFPPREAEPAYASLLGRLTIVYPHRVGWLILIAAAGLAALALRRRPIRALLSGTGLALLLPIAAGLLFHLMRLATGAPYGFTAVRPLLARFGWFEASLTLAGLGLLLLISGRRKADLPAGLVIVTLIVATAIQALAPPAAVLACWAALAGAAVLLLAPRVPLLAAGLAGVAIAQVAATAHLIELAVGENIPQVGAYFLLLAAAALAPLLPARGLRPIALACLALAALGIAAIRFVDHTSPSQPRPSQILYVTDETGRFWRGSSLPAIDRWTDAALKADGASGWTRRPLPPFFTGRDYAQGIAMAPARPAAIPAPVVTRTVDGLRILPPPGTRIMDLRITLDRPGRLVVAGAATAAMGEASLRWSAPAGPIDIRVEGARIAGGLVSALHDGWPADAKPLAPRSPDTMPWYNTDATLAIRRIP